MIVEKGKQGKQGNHEYYEVMNNVVNDETSTNRLKSTGKGAKKQRRAEIVAEEEADAEDVDEWDI